MSPLHRIAGCDNSTRLADIIFVHGLNPFSSDTREFAFGTWGGKNEGSDFWPNWLYHDLMKHSDCPMPVAVWLMEYDSAASAWLGHTMPLYDRAGNILDRMHGERLGSKPILFICHSLGGLVVKELLQRAVTGNVSDWVPIGKQIRGIVFLSTPHTGADFAAFISHLGVALRLTESVKELQANAVTLRQLSEWYSHNAPELNIKTAAYCEKFKTNGVLVVDETSANPHIPHVAVIPLDKDHGGVAKLTTRQEQPYSSILRFLEECIQASIPRPAAKRSFQELCQQYQDVLTPYLDFLIRENSTLDPRGLGKDLRQGGPELDEIYVSLALERQARRGWDSDSRDRFEEKALLRRAAIQSGRSDTPASTQTQTEPESTRNYREFLARHPQSRGMPRRGWNRR